MNTKEISINGKVFVIKPFHAVKAWEIFKKISCVLTAGSSQAIALKLLEQDEDNKLLFLLLSEVLCDNAPIITTQVFDKLFSARLTDMLAIVCEVINVNYDDFLQKSGFGSVLENIQTLLTSPKSEQLTKS